MLFNKTLNVRSPFLPLSSKWTFTIQTTGVCEQNMRDRMERFVLLPFTAGCISESSIAVGLQQAKRSKMDMGSTPTSKTPFHRPTFNPPSSYTVCVYLSRVLTSCFDHEGEKDEDEEQYEEDEESLSGESLKSPPSLLAIPRFQKLFKNLKNFSQSFVYKDELEDTEMGMEIGLPTDVKHVTHIGLDGCASSILSKGWNNLTNPDMTNLPSFSSTPLQLAMAKNAENPTIRSLLETK
ncbi:CRIB domain-containing protein RIC4-like isoform X2 [Salvia splendens]|uniref:CRIB domain-containing protein RIC4-like isoform X2 n=1 Tax=Salvia splendens TaxID=180675 RepID=UPI001C267F16|nr:CRIB domain-containing protein RIC4-like isoform X2 [Salvia splendens]